MFIMERLTQKRIDVDGSWITIDVYGPPDGPAVVMVPGVLSDAEAWRGVAERLGGWPTVAVVNRRGRHPSGPLTPRYSLATEVADARAVLREFTEVAMVFGWSYGGLVALRLAGEVDLPHVVAYEPVVAPFGAAALPDLRAAAAAADADGIVEVALRQVGGMDESSVRALRADDAVWAELCRLGAPALQETLAINEAPSPGGLAARAGRVDLILGELNAGSPPYGTTFEDVARHVGRARVHRLVGQGHLAHLEAPEALAALLDDIGRGAGPTGAQGRTAYYNK